METAKLAAIRSALTALLVALALLLTGCGQEGSPSPGTQAGSIPISGTPASGTPASGTAASDTSANSMPAGSTPGDSLPAASTPVAEMPTDSAPAAGTTADSTPADAASLQATRAPVLATATVLAGDAGIAPAAGLDLTKVDPCKLLTEAEVKSVMGNVPFAPKLQTQAAYHAGCSYVEPDLTVHSPRLFLSLDQTDTWMFHTEGADAVSGLQGEAVTQLVSSGWRTVWVLLKGKAVVSLDIDPPDVEKAKQLLSQAIKRLP